MRPNYFLAIKISDADILRHIFDLQNQILSSFPDLKSCLINLETLHLTLGVCTLDDEDLEFSLNIMQEVEKQIRCFCRESFRLDVKGLGMFDNQVLFAKITEQDDRNHIYKISEIFEEKINSTRKYKPFKPHVTILKLSRDRKIMRNYKKSQALKSFVTGRLPDVLMGSQLVEEIQLLSINLPKEPNGYYKSLCTINLANCSIPKYHLSSELEACTKYLQQRKEEIHLSIKVTLDTLFKSSGMQVS